MTAPIRMEGPPRSSVGLSRKARSLGRLLLALSFCLAFDGAVYAAALYGLFLIAWRLAHGAFKALR